MGSLPSVMLRLRRGSARLGRLDRLGWTVGTLRPEASLDALERLAARATVPKGERGEASELAPLLLESLGNTISRPAMGERETR